MKFIYGKQNMKTAEQAQENCYLLTNGTGGYSSLSMAYSAARNDQGLLISASTAPTVRHTLVQRMREILQIGDRFYDLSTQEMLGEDTLGEKTNGRENGAQERFRTEAGTSGDSYLSEKGYLYLSSFVWENQPQWMYELCGITVRRRIIMRPDHNTVVIHYDLMNAAEKDGILTLEPAFLCAPKGQTLQQKNMHSYSLQTEDSQAQQSSTIQNNATLMFNGYQVFIGTDAPLAAFSPVWEHVFYRHDLEDGRTADGYLMRCMKITLSCPAGKKTGYDVILSDHEIFGECARTQNFNPLQKTDFRSVLRAFAEQIQAEADAHLKTLESRICFRDPFARQLARSADAYITRRDSTGGRTIAAGYPFFADWGRDTMISLPGCTLATGNYDTAESILRTFLEYERGGLVPNLFPEGGEEPRYNTVDAALLLINSVWLYYQRTGNREFLKEAYPTMQRIIEGYRKGTEHGIHMDEDGLIAAGQGMDQVTWMDVCVEGILPTPRHGKPVEINAYWYNALCIMAEITRILQEADAGGVTSDAVPFERQKTEKKQTESEDSAWQEYMLLAARVRKSFLEKFWMEEKGYLKDVISDPAEKEKSHPGILPDDQIRCNQIWTITLPFTMLSQEQEARVVNTVYRCLYTPCGIRTLDPADPQFHPTYGGTQKLRDLAYHQGTTWVFPLGAFYKAYLKVNDFSGEAREWVKEHLAMMEPMLREGCIGQLPEIYDGLVPGASKGCFAQAWSVGEILTVYEMLETNAEEMSEAGH